MFNSATAILELAEAGWTRRIIDLIIKELGVKEEDIINWYIAGDILYVDLPREVAKQIGK